MVKFALNFQGMFVTIQKYFVIEKLHFYCCLGLRNPDVIFACLNNVFLPVIDGLVVKRLGCCSCDCEIVGSTPTRVAMG